ncbi:MAG: 1-acyl-sn-glycerol-3-phosphate acyltransferase [Chitinophagales bacterium]
MLLIWRERDGVDTKESNDPTFNACADILKMNGMVGIYPEGNCINEQHIRPLKKGICRIAFLAEERADFDLDVHIIPVGVNYTGAEKFKKWQLINFGKPILLKQYVELYKSNPNQAINILKDDIEKGMQEAVLHIPHSHYHKDVEELAFIHGRYRIMSEHRKYEPVSKLYAEKEIAAEIENLRHTDSDGMKKLVHDLHQYQKRRDALHFRENTFDPARHDSFSIGFMALYFIFFLPFFLFGLVTNILPYTLIHKTVESKIKQKIFWSSLKYVFGLILFPIYYLILTILVKVWLGSWLSAGHIPGNVPHHRKYRILLHL